MTNNKMKVKMMPAAGKLIPKLLTSFEIIARP